VGITEQYFIRTVYHKIIVFVDLYRPLGLCNKELCALLSRPNSNSISIICSPPPTISLKVHYIVRTWCEKEDFRWRLNVAVDDCMSFSSVGR